jgi:hypothetical protein
MEPSGGNPVTPLGRVEWCLLVPLQIHPPMWKLMGQWSLLCLDLPLFLNENRWWCRWFRILTLANLCKAGLAITVLDVIHFPRLEMVCGAQDSIYDLKILDVYKLILQGKDNALRSCWSRQSSW